MSHQDGHFTFEEFLEAAKSQEPRSAPDGRYSTDPRPVSLMEEGVLAMVRIDNGRTNITGRHRKNVKVAYVVDRNWTIATVAVLHPEHRLPMEVYVGASRCHPDDEYDASLGRLAAFRKAVTP